MTRRRRMSARLAVFAVLATTIVGGQVGGTATVASGQVASAPDVLPTLPTIRVTQHFDGAEGLLAQLQLDARGEQFKHAWMAARDEISHDGVRANTLASGTRLLEATADLVRHLQGNTSAVSADKRRAVTGDLRAGADLLLATALGDLKLALSDPIGVATDRVQRANQVLSQATKAHQQAQSVRGNDQSALAHLTTGWRKLMEGFSGLGIELDGDLDGDGLSNHLEFIIGSNPFSADTDRDGLTDGFEFTELFTVTSAVIADSDGDGVGDSSEDFDSDGLTHLEEQRFGSSPLEPDLDGDGLDDADEHRLGTDPKAPDTDGDTLSDGVEPRQGLSPLAADTDGDGVRDDVELVSGNIQGPGGVSATITGTGNLVDNAQVVTVPPNQVTSDVPGQASSAYDFQITEESAQGMTGGVITLPFDSTQISSEDARVFYFDEDESLWRPAAETQTVDASAGTVSVAVEHFSTYAVFNAGEWERKWTQQQDSCLARGTSKLDIALILDSSGSIAKTDPDDRRLDAAKAVVDSMVQGDRAAVVEFDDDANLVAELSGDRGDLRRAIRTVDAEGSPTRIGTGVRVALDELIGRGRTDAVRGAILIADGAGTYNEDLTQEAHDAGIVVHTVGLGNDSDFSVLRDIAEGTGGSFARVSRAENLPEVFRRLADSTGGANPVDSDGDGLSDCRETTGMLAANGRTYRTDPHLADTDGDDINDGEEVGELVDFARLGTETGIGALSRLGQAGARVHALRSDPTVMHSDSDGLVDATELDDGTSRFDPDSDNDGLYDGTELEIGTNPLLSNSDGDDFSDAYEYHSEDGLNPLYYDPNVSKRTYIAHFAVGFVAGDFKPLESMAWLVGYLCSSILPVADARDLIANAIRGQWVGAATSAAAMIPVAEAAALLKKIAAFVKKYPSKAREAAVFVAKHPKFSHDVKVDVLRRVVLNPGTWDGLIAKGADEAALVRMAGGGTNLDELFEATLRARHVTGRPSAIHSSWKSGENWLESAYGASIRGVDRQVWRSTRNLWVYDNGFSFKVSIGIGRYLDVLRGGVAREAKTGWVRYSKRLETQIRKDWLLVEAGQASRAHWHFMPSGRSNSVGADPRILDLLDAYDIPYTIHMPIT